MQRSAVEAILGQLLAGKLDLASAASALAGPSAESAELPDTTLDLDRQRRCGYPEVVYGEGKTAISIERIARRLAAEETDVFVTRVSPEKASELAGAFPSARYNEIARTWRLPVESSGEASLAVSSPRPRVVVITAGTSDLPVAAEAQETLDWMGVDTEIVHDVGVAGPHRLPRHLDKLRGADAIVVAAGMEGALPSVVGGHVDCPVIAVPTSVGYGAAFGGLAALLGMLNSCAANVVVVNIDAGFKAGYVAGLIARRRRASS